MLQNDENERLFKIVTEENTNESQLEQVSRDVEKPSESALLADKTPKPCWQKVSEEPTTS